MKTCMAIECFCFITVLLKEKKILINASIISMRPSDPSEAAETCGKKANTSLQLC